MMNMFLAFEIAEQAVTFASQLTDKSNTDKKAAALKFAEEGINDLINLSKLQKADAGELLTMVDEAIDVVCKLPHAIRIFSTKRTATA